MNILKPVGRFLQKNGPLLLTVGACAGVVASNVLTARSVLKANDILNDIRDEKTRGKIIKTYAPPAIAAVGTIGMIIGAHMLDKKIQAGLLAACGLVSMQFQEYRSIASPNTNDDAAVMDEVRHRMLERYADEVPCEGLGEDYILWKDNYHERPFYARETDILKGVSYINKCLLDPNSGHWAVSLDDFYTGYTKADPEPQDAVYGWTNDYMWEQWDCCLIEVDWTTDGEYIDPQTGIRHECRHLYWWCEPCLNYISYDPDTYEAYYNDVYNGKTEVTPDI